MSAGEPSSTTEARSLSGCNCHESGGSPPCRRVASTVRAFDPPPPDTAAFLNVTLESAVVKAVSNTFSAAASEPEVHHEKTSSWPLPPPADWLPPALGVVLPEPPQADRASTADAVTRTPAYFSRLNISLL